MRRAAFILLALTAIGMSASQPIHAAETSTRLTAEKVAEMADAYARTKVEDLDRFTADRPKFDSKSRTWVVFYHQTKAPYAPDHDFWVHIDDASGNPCLEYGIVPACA
jgi:DNA-binding FadR family transcriptional regulator